MSKEAASARTRSTDEQIEIDAPIETVWKALNDPEELKRWFPLDAGVNPDGSVWMSWGDFRFESKPEIVEPPHHLRAVTGPMVMEIFLESHGGKTRVRIVQSGFGHGAEWDSEIEATRSGWWFQLRGLQHYLEVHRGSPRRVVWARQPFSISRAEAWKRVMSPQALLREGRIEGLREGESYRIVTADGDVLEGVAYKSEPPHDFVASVNNLNRSFLRVQFDDLPMRGQKDVGLWLSTYGLPEAQVRGIEERWRAMLARLFA